MPHESADLLILGSGATAFAAATRARDLGKSALMVEARTLGGTCVNRGCLPSKNLLAAAKLVYDAAHPRIAGLAPARVPVDFRTLIAQKDDLIGEYREQHYTSLLATGAAPVRILHGHASLVDAQTAVVTSPDGTTRTVTGAEVLIATGAQPALPDIPGLATTPYLTSDLLTSQEPMELRERPASLLILGGGYVALELGQLFARLGTEVTLLERAPRLLPTYEPEIGEALLPLLRGEGLHIVTQAQVRQVAGGAARVSVIADVAGQRSEFVAETLLIATGRVPATHGMGLEHVGVRLDAQGAVVVDDELRTSVPHVWAAGDVIGGATGSQMATPVAARDGGIAASNALSGTRLRVNHRVLPRALFTDPAVGVVGMTEAEATAAGIACDCTAIPFSAVPRAGALRDTRGVLKLVVEAENRRILGVAMLGTDAAEVIQVAAMAMRFNATADDLIEHLFIYPTMAEALKIAAISFTKDVDTLSCCAS